MKRKVSSPMPFGCVPIRQLTRYRGPTNTRGSSPMPFGCVPIRQCFPACQEAFRDFQSPMPFGCVPIRQCASSTGRTTACIPGLQCLSAVCLSGSCAMWEMCYAAHGVSNAFRLCAYPAVVASANFERDDDCWSPMPFGCVPIRQMTSSHWPRGFRRWVSNAFRLCAYPAVSDRNQTHLLWAVRLQCLSAVCLSGRNTLHLIVATHFVSPMPFGCVPIRQILPQP